MLKPGLQAVLLAGLVATTACAQKGAIDFTKQLTDLKGSPLLGADKTPMTLGEVAATALETSMEQDRQVPADQKVKQDLLARNIYRCKSCSLSVEDIALIKARINMMYGPLIVGQAFKILDPPATK
jgi:hypothetical protein